MLSITDIGLQLKVLIALVLQKVKVEVNLFNFLVLIINLFPNKSPNFETNLMREKGTLIILGFPSFNAKRFVNSIIVGSTPSVKLYIPPFEYESFIKL